MKVVPVVEMTDRLKVSNNLHGVFFMKKIDCAII